MATFNRVDLDGPGKLSEFTASAAVRPGDILGRLVSDLGVGGGPDYDCVSPTSVAGQGGVLFAAHDRLQGKTIEDNYVSGDKVQCFAPKRGDNVWAWLKDEENVATGAPLTNDDSGSLVAAVVGTDVVVAFAEEALDLTAADTPADARIVVRIA